MSPHLREVWRAHTFLRYAEEDDLPADQHSQLSEAQQHLAHAVHYWPDGLERTILIAAYVDLGWELDRLARSARRAPMCRDYAALIRGHLEDVLRANDPAADFEEVIS